MSINISLLPGAIAELFAQASRHGVLTLADRYGLLAALLQESLTDEERFAIDRVLYAIRRGQLDISSDLSMEGF